MANDPSFWDAQIARLLAGHRDVELSPERVKETGLRLAELLRKDAALEENVSALLGGYQEPEIPTDRVAELGEELARQLAARAPRRHRVARRETTSLAWGLAAAAVFIIAVLIAIDSNPSRPAPRSVPAVDPPAVVSTPVPEKPVPAPEPPRPEKVVQLPPPQPAPLVIERPVEVKPVLPTPPPIPAPPPPSTTVAPQVAVAAILDHFTGDVRVDQVAAAAGSNLIKGTELVTEGKASRAALRYPDGTRLFVDADSSVRLTGTQGDGIALALSRGTLAAEVVRQAPGKSLVITTPQAEVRVLGTKFTLSLQGEAARLEVREGKVRLTRSDGATIDVGAGHFSVASRGVVLLSRPIPEEAKPIFYELEDFGTARGVKPADGMVRRIFHEPFDSATGGWCVAVPGSGMEIAGDVKLTKGIWHLWVRYRDENGNPKVSFTALAGEQPIGQATTPGRNRNWNWKRFTFTTNGGIVRIALRSTYEGIKASPDGIDFRQSPYAALNRWDRICLTSDENFTPD